MATGKEILNDAKQKMAKSGDALQRTLADIRAGQANASLLNSVKVEYYGAPTPLNQVASITIPEARQLLITPYDESVLEEIEKAKKIIESIGFKVKYSTNLFANTNKYSATAEEKANDINEMFADKEVKMIWCAKGGENSNSVFDYINYDIIRQNPKIICGYSDITSLTNIITEKTGLITFSGTNFKTIATDETDYSLKEALKRFISRKFRIRYTRR